MEHFTPSAGCSAASTPRSKASCIRAPLRDLRLGHPQCRRSADGSHMWPISRIVLFSSASRPLRRAGRPAGSRCCAPPSSITTSNDWKSSSTKTTRRISGIIDLGDALYGRHRRSRDRRRLCGLDHPDPIGAGAAIARLPCEYPLLEEEVDLPLRPDRHAVVTSVTISASRRAHTAEILISRSAKGRPGACCANSMRETRLSTAILRRGLRFETVGGAARSPPGSSEIARASCRFSIVQPRPIRPLSSPTATRRIR